MSSHGRIGSAWGRFYIKQANWKILKPYKNRLGYELIKLKGSHNLVHRLVLSAFVGAPAEGMHGCHNDSNPSNNMLDNLRWDTRSGNMSDRRGNGSMHEGEGCTWWAKLKLKQVEEIRARVAGGEKQKDLAVEYSVSRATISQIHRRRSWHFGEKECLT